MYKELLNAVKAKIDIYDKHKELSGENFNIFYIMNKESDEVWTHSAIISELLNPKGSHSLGSKPLELFIKQFKEHFLKEDFKIDFVNAISIKEECLISEHENYFYDRLDIVVKEKYAVRESKNIFCIENKIYAGEQEDQLLRYKKQYPNGILFYLTLTGEESKQLIDNKDNNIYTPIAYSNNEKDSKGSILNWLEECVKYAYDKPMVREVLNQYIYLIKKLTNQTTNKDMTNDIVEIINDNFEASTEIYNNFGKALTNRQNVFLVNLEVMLKKQIPAIQNVKEIVIDEKNHSMHRLKIFLKDNYFVSFHFKSTNEVIILIGKSNIGDIDDEILNKPSGFKDKNWNNDNESLYYKTPYGFLGNPKNILDAENGNKIEEIAKDLINISMEFLSCD